MQCNEIEMCAFVCRIRVLSCLNEPIIKTKTESLPHWKQLSVLICFLAGRRQNQYRTCGWFEKTELGGSCRKARRKGAGGAFSVPRLKNALSIVRGKAQARDDLPFFTVGEPRGRYRGV